jgi:hypothetical protein
MSVCGIFPHQFVGEAYEYRVSSARFSERQVSRDFTLHACVLTSAIGPNVWSGRALQEAFVDPGKITVLHQCIRPLLGACAPGHHGYQRAYDLISGQASTGPLGPPVFACAGKTDPPWSSHPLADLGGQTKLGHR